MVYKSGQIFLPFCHNSRVWQTDRRTDRQTDGQTDRILIARPRLHSMQRGKMILQLSKNRWLVQRKRKATVLFLQMFLLTTREAARYIILVESVCLSVCLPDDNFRKSQREKLIYAHPVYLQWIRVIRIWRLSGQGQGHRSNKGRRFSFSQCKASITAVL